MVFLIAFVVYWLTLCPTVYVGDSGELVTAAHTLGISHPTGYPAYMLLTKLFTLVVPWGSVAFRANLFSAVCAALAAHVLALCLRRLVATRWVADASALFAALLPAIWSQATVARTYSLAAVISAGLLYLMVRWSEDPRPRWWVRHNLLLGVGLANHLMVLAHLPALLCFILMRRPRDLLQPRAVVLAAVALLPGLALYGYFPLRARADPAIEFHVPVAGGGELRDTASLSSLASYLRRDLHHDHRWAKGPADYAVVLSHHAAETLRQFSFVGVPLLVLGGVLLFRRRRALLVSLLVLWAANLAPLAWHGAWWDIFLYPRYMTTGYLGLVLVLCEGLARVHAWLVVRLPSVAAGLLVQLVPVSMLAMNFHTNDHSENFLAEDYARSLLAELPAGAQLGAASDNAFFPLMYLHLVEGERPDIQLVNELQLRGKADVQLRGRMTDAEFQARWGRDPRPLYSPDDVNPFGLPVQRQTLLLRILAPGERPPPLPELRLPEIRSLDGSVYLDPICSSVAAQIEADLASACFVRGRLDEAFARVEAVLQVPAPRCWGYWRAADLCTQAFAQLLDRGEVDGARRWLELAQRCIRRAAALGDPRDGVTRAYQSLLPGLLRFVHARQLLPGDPEASFGELQHAAEALLVAHPLAFQVQRMYLAELARRGRNEALERHLQALSAAMPENPEWEGLLRRLRSSG